MWKCLLYSLLYSDGWKMAEHYGERWVVSQFEFPDLTGDTIRVHGGSKL